MDHAAINEEVVRSIKPRLDELGFEGFVLVGYVRDGEGKVSRSIISDHKNNPMVADALRPLLQVGFAWVQSQ